DWWRNELRPAQRRRTDHRSLASLHDLELGPVEVLAVLDHRRGHQQVALVLYRHVEAVAAVEQALAQHHADLPLLVRRRRQQDRGLQVRARARLGNLDRDRGLGQQLDADLALLVFIAGNAADQADAPVLVD